MKKNKLYTINRFNSPSLQRNVFADGGPWDKLAGEYWGKKGIPDELNEAVAGGETTLTDAYMNSKNAFGISKADNPFSKGNLQGGLKSMVGTPIGGALVSGAAGAIGGLAGNAISGGLESGAGSAISSIGSTVGSAVGSVNPVLGAAINVGSQILGGGINRAIGTSTNEAELRKANAGTASLLNTQGDVNNFDDIKGVTAVEGFSDPYKSGFLRKGNARRKNASLREARVLARQFANGQIENNIMNLNDNQLNDALANYAAFGGLLNTPNYFAIGGDEEEESARQSREKLKELGRGWYYGTIGPWIELGKGLYHDYQRAKAKRDAEKRAKEHSSFAGSGATMRWTPGYKPKKKNANFNEAFDEASLAGAETFIFGNHLYTTDEEDDPIRELNNRYVGFSRKEKDVAKLKPTVFLGGEGPYRWSDLSKKPVVAIQDVIPKAEGGFLHNHIVPSNNIFAIGGDLQTHGGDFSDGLTTINAGLSHEKNPNGGVQVGKDSEGIPNLVEEGEAIYNDYVFSNRLIVPRGMRGKYGKRNKYAKGGKLNKGNSDEQLVPYELEALKPFEGLTFADAAKKAEKLSGVDERPTDPIAQRGLLAMLQVLAGTQEKEREKEKLQEIKDTIDSMTPEEFAMLQQLMQANQQLANDLAMLEQLQMIPQGMEYMQLQPVELPIAALGGLLDTYNNTYAYGGNLDKFKKELEERGLTLEDYYMAHLKLPKGSPEELAARDLFRQAPEALINDKNFDKDFAETFLNRIETITKQYNRRAKRQGIKVDDLQGAAKAQYNRELKQAIQKGAINADYDVSQDTELTFNNSRVSTAKNKQQAYSNAATYNDLIARGGKAVELDDLGRPTWESITGLNKIDNSAEGFYDKLGDLTGTALNDRGIYDYNAAQKSSIDVDDYKNVKLRGWNKNEDGTYTVSSEYDNPNLTSLSQGNSDATYPIADIGDLKSGSKEYDDALKAIQDNKDYLDQTKYVKDALESANGDINKLREEHPDVLNYIQYLDANSGNVKGKLIGEDGKLSKTAVKDYTRRREDSQYGIYHYLFDDAKNAAANRYYYKDKDKDGKDVKVYISKPEGTDFTISLNPTVTTGTDGTLFNDYEVTGLNRNRTLTLLPTGEVVDVTNLSDLSNWKKLDKPVLADNTDNLGYGINGTTNWVDYGSNPRGASVTTENDPFPKAPSWPYLLGAGLQLGSLGYNLLSPADYSNANAMISAALDAGTYNPIEFRPIGNYLTYRPLDIWYEQNALNAQSRATDRNLMNTSGGNRGTTMAGLLANGYNSQIASGNLFRQAQEYNDALRKQVGEFNKDTDKFNSEGFLKADMANQDAATRARGYTLEGLKSGYAMRQAIDDAKANAINAGLTGLGTMLFNYALNKYSQDMLGWGIRNGAYAPLAVRANEGADGGRIRRYKGLTF